MPLLILRQTPPTALLPELPLAINWGHPLAKDLRALIVPGGGRRAIDLVSGRMSDAVATYTSTAFGRCISQWQFTSTITPELNWSGGPFSAGAHFFTPVATGSSQNPEILSRGVFVGSTNNQGWALKHRQFGDAIYSWEVYRNENSVFPLKTTVAATLTHHSLFGTSDATTRHIYLDGRHENSTANNAVPLAVGDRVLANVASTQIEPIFVAYAWTRCLTPEEALWLNMEPYAMLISAAPRGAHLNNLGARIGSVV
jgi:hypothetical protein